MKHLIYIILILSINNKNFAQCFDKISAGGLYNSAIKPNGTIYIWGNGSFGWGALATGNDNDVLNPTQSTSLNTWQSITNGQYNTFAIKSNGTLWAIGSNFYGELGNGTFGNGNFNNGFVQVGTTTNWKQISANAYFVAGLKTNGTVWTWGINTVGQLGDGSSTDHYVPVQVGTATNWKKVVTTTDATLALKTDGSLWAWGANPELSIDDSSVQGSLIPIQVGSFNGGTFTDYQDIATSAGSRTILTIRNYGQLRVWGASNGGYCGSLGQGTNVCTVIRPTRVGTDSDWAFVAVGKNSSYAIKTKCTLWAWGGNPYGELGDGTTVDKGYPTQIGTDTNWSSVAGGTSFATALKTDGSLWTWGDASLGQLGVGSYTSSLVPVPIAVSGCNLATSQFETEKMSIVPNPTKEFVTLKFDKTANVGTKISIYDLMGKLIDIFDVNTNENSLTINTTGYAKGIYLIVTKEKEIIVSQEKLVIQ